MNARNLLTLGSIPVALFCLVVAPQSDTPAAPVSAQTQNKTDEKAPLAEFMRTKLQASSTILEGLCMEDPALVKEGAEKLREMTKASRWAVLTDAEYREHSREFRDNAAQVIEAAEEGDFSRAALRWFDVTVSCLDCHHHVRKQPQADK